MAVLRILRVDGVEFLASGVNISRGGYFYQNGALRLSDIAQPAPNIVAAKSKLAAATYQFDERVITVELENRSDQSLVYFFVASDRIKTARDDSGTIASSALAVDTNELTLFQGDSVLKISGITKVWGPWEQSHQVVEIQLEPGELRTVRLEVRETTTKEQQEIAAMFSPPQEAPMTVLSPRNYQVFQRRSETEGEVLISGRCKSDVDTVEVLLTGTSQYGQLPGGWQAIATVSDIHQFNLRMVLPAGDGTKRNCEQRKQARSSPNRPRNALASEKCLWELASRTRLVPANSRRNNPAGWWLRLAERIGNWQMIHNRELPTRARAAVFGLLLAT